MTDEEKKAEQQLDPALELTATNVDDGTDEHLESLVRGLDGLDDQTAGFVGESACRDFIQRVSNFGPPEMSAREIGQYELLERIGRGGMGEVWTARQKKLDRVVAIKLLHPTISANREASDRFEQEMRAIGNLQHDNIVQAFDAGEVDGILYLAMEYIDGTSLSEALEKLAKQDTELSVKKACHLVTEAATGLQYAHENGIVHRDIKPSNIMVTRSGRVKLLDMGLARVSQSDTPMPELTRQGQIMGTVDYMPPEQLRDSRSVGVPADIYALGATFYKLLTRRAPFADERTNTVESKILAIASETPPSVRELRRDVPEALSSLIDEMLHKDASKRPQSAGDVIERIATAATPVSPNDSSITPIGTSSGGQTSQRNGQRSRGRLLAAGLLFGAIVVLGGILLTLKDPEYGNLVIEGPAGVRIRATRVDDPGEFYEFTAGKGGSSLRHGRWRITIVSEGFDEFELGGDGVVRIENAAGDVVKITRKPRVSPEASGKPDLVFAKWFFEKHLSGVGAVHDKKLWVRTKDGLKEVQKIGDLPADFKVHGAYLIAAGLTLSDYERLGRLHNLEQLTLWKGAVQHAEAFSHLPDSLVSLKIDYLDLHGLTIDPHMGPLPNLSAFSFHGSDADCIQWLKALSSRTPNLRTLGVWRPRASTVVPFVASFQKLEEFSLNFSPCTADLVEILADLPSLRAVALLGGVASDESLVPLSQLPNLKSLDIRGSDLNGQFLEAFRDSETLTSIDLGHLRQPGDAMEHLTSLRFLKGLGLTGPTIRDEHVERLNRIPHRFRLGLHSTSCTKEKIEELLGNDRIDFREHPAMFAPVSLQVVAWLMQAGAKIDCDDKIQPRGRFSPTGFDDFDYSNAHQIYRVDLTAAKFEVADLLHQLSRLEDPVAEVVVPAALPESDRKRLSDLKQVASVAVSGKTTPSRATNTTLSPAEVRQRLSGVEWNHHNHAASFPGYAVEPPKIPGIDATWQIVPRFAHQANAEYHLSPSGDYVIKLHDEISDPLLRLIERRTGRLRCVVDLDGWLRHTVQVSWSPDESQFAVLTGDTIRFFDQRGLELSRWKVPVELNRITWSPEGDRLFLYEELGKAYEERTPNGEVIRSFSLPEIGRIHQATWSPDGRHLALLVDHVAHVFDKDGGEPVCTVDPPDNIWARILWHPSGKKILTSGPRRDGAQQWHLWDFHGNKSTFATTRLHEMFIAFSPDGRFALTNYGDIRDAADQVVTALDMGFAGYIQDLNVTARWLKANRIMLMSQNRGAAYSVEYSGTGRKVAEYHWPVPVLQHSASFVNDTPISVGGWARNGQRLFNWTKNTAKQLVPDGTKDSTSYAAFGSDGDLALQHSQSLVPLFDIAGNSLRRLEGNAQSLLSWNRDGSRLAHVIRYSEPRRIRVWKAGELVAEFATNHSADIRGLTWSPTKDVLMVWDSKQTVSVWDPTQPERPLLAESTGGVSTNSHWHLDRSCPSWNPAGGYLAIPVKTGVRVFDTSTWKEAATIPWEKDPSPCWWRSDGQSLLVGHRAFDLEGKQVSSFEGLHGRWFVDLFWAKDGNIIGVGHDFVAIQDRDSAKPTILELPGYNRPVVTGISTSSRGLNAQLVSADGQWLIARRGVTTGNGAGDICLIDIQSRRHAWTGLAFSNGHQIRIAPTGEVVGDTEGLDNYLAYIVRYDNGRMLPLTQTQFASRIGMSPAEQFVQRMVDLGATLTLSDGTVVDGRSSVRVPVPDEVADINLSGNTYVTVADLSGIKLLSNLRSLDLSGTSVASPGPIVDLRQLRKLKLSGTRIKDGIGALLPRALEELDVSKTEVGDFLTYDLAEFPSLKRLSIAETRTTPDGITKLQRALPACEIEPSPK